MRAIMDILVHCHHRHRKRESKFFPHFSSTWSSVVSFSSLTLSPTSQLNLSCMRGGPGSEGSIDPDETPEERERREKDRRAANNARER